jgi:hypothetical protein
MKQSVRQTGSALSLVLFLSPDATVAQPAAPSVSESLTRTNPPSVQRYIVTLRQPTP